MAEFPACIHCGKPIRNTDYATWWDIGEVAGWICHKSYRTGYDAVRVYRTIRRRLSEGLVDTTGHVAPPKEESPDLGDIF